MVFVYKGMGELLCDEVVNVCIVEVVEVEGVDVWFFFEFFWFLGDVYDLDVYEMVMDIMDVWFDLGVIYVFVFE